MTKKPPGRVPVEAAATDAEVRAALDGLSDADAIRLQKYAKWQVRAIGRSRLKGRDWNDLFTDAIIATLSRDRLWRKEFSLVQHLRRVIESMANHWRRAANPDVAVPASQLGSEGEEGETYDPLDVPGKEPSVQDSLCAREVIEGIEEHFRENDLVLFVMEALGEGYRPHELSEATGTSQKECEAALKRLRRYCDQRFPERRRP